jgi:hypothetical protein
MKIQASKKTSGPRCLRWYYFTGTLDKERQQIDKEASKSQDDPVQKSGSLMLPISTGKSPICEKYRITAQVFF